MGDILISQNVIRGPYLQSPTNSEIIIKWRTDVPTDARVWYGTDSTNLSQVIDKPVVEDNHEIKITGLQTFTTYYYAVGTSTMQLSSGANHHFKTSPIIGSEQPVRTWVIGDFGKGNQSQLDVMQSYLDYTGTTHTDVWLWMGDNAYSDGEDTEYQTKVFDQFDSIFPFMPFFPTPGNHDYNSMNGYTLLTPTGHGNHEGAYYDIVTVPKNGEIGGFPSGTEAFYSFDYANIHYICLNSEIQNSSARNNAMENWLTQDLANNTQNWTIAYWHQPPYTKGSHDSDLFYEIFMKGMRKNILPILDAGGVDLVLNGHSHNYERSYLLKGHYENSGDIEPEMFLDASSGNPNNGESYRKYKGQGCDHEGIVYAVVGNSGSKTGPGDDTGLNHPTMYISDAEDAVGSLVVDVHGDTLNGTYLRATGQIVDEFQILKIHTNCDSITSNVEALVNDIVVKVYSHYETGEFRIRFDITNDTPIQIQLFDMNGRTVYTHDFGHLQAGDHYHRIYGNQLNLPAGIYNFAIISDKNVVSKKVFKLK